MLIAVCALVGQAGFVQSARAQWTVTGSLTSTSTETAIRPCADSSGNVVVTGKSDSNAYVSKYNSSGVSQWSQAFNVSGTNTALEPKAITLGPSGDVYVAMRSTWYAAPYPPPTAPGTRVTVMKLSGSSGTPAWTSTFYIGTSSSSPVAIAVDASGNAYVTGVDSPSSGDEIFVARIGASGGSPTWTYTYAGQGNASNTGNFPVGIAITSTGDVIVGGSSEGAYSNGDSVHFTVFKLNASTGAQSWLTQYKGSEYRKSGVTAFAFYNDTVYLTGTARFTGSTSWDITSVAYNASGTQTLEYVKTDGVTVDDSSAAITAGPSGVFVWGRLQTYGSHGEQIYTGVIITPASGAILISNVGDFSPVALGSNSSGFSLSGILSPSGVSTLYNRRYSSGGTLLSSYTYTGTGNPVMGGMVEVNGMAFVAGATNTTSGADYFLIKY